MARKAAPKEEPKAIELQMKQPDGSIYNWHPSGAMDAKCLDAFDESKQTHFAPEEEKFIREYIEMGICQCGWAGNSKFLNKEQAAVFGLWLNDKNEDSRRVIVLGEERMKVMINGGSPFNTDIHSDTEETEKVSSPASTGAGEAATRIDVENIGGSSKVHVDTEEKKDEKKEEESSMLNNDAQQQNAQAQQQGFFNEVCGTIKSATDSTVGKVALVGIGAAGALYAKKKFFDDPAEDSDWASGDSQVASQGGSMFF